MGLTNPLVHQYLGASIDGRLLNSKHIEIKLYKNEKGYEK